MNFLIFKNQNYLIFSSFFHLIVSSCHQNFRSIPVKFFFIIKKFQVLKILQIQKKRTTIFNLCNKGDAFHSKFFKLKKNET